MGRTMLRFKDMNDRQVAITLLEKAHSLFRRGKVDTVCEAIGLARDQIRTTNPEYIDRVARVHFAINDRIMGSLNSNTYVTSWLYEVCPAYWKWRDGKRDTYFNTFTDKRVRRYRRDWIADMIRTLRSGGFI